MTIRSAVVLLALFVVASGVRGEDPERSPWLDVTRLEGDFTITVNDNQKVEMGEAAPGAILFHDASWAVRGTFVLDLPRDEDGERRLPGPGARCASFSGRTNSSAAMSGDYGVRPGPGIKTGYVVSDSLSPRDEPSGKSNHVHFGFDVDLGTFDFSLAADYAGRLVTDSSEYIGKIREGLAGAEDDELGLKKLLEALALSAVPPGSKPFRMLVEASCDDERLPASPGVVSGTKKVKFMPFEVLGPAVEGTFTFSLRPSTDGPRIDIVKLEQSGGPRTSDPKQLVFEGGSLTFVAEAKVDPPEFATAVEWRAPDVGGEKAVVTGRSAEGGVAKAEITYRKLPADNSEFGPRELRAFAGDDEAVKPFDLFFSRDGKDNPVEPEAGGGKASNWYVYWRQGAVPGLERFEFSADPSMGGGYQPGSGRLLVTASTPGVIPAIDATLTTKDGAHSYHLVRRRAEGVHAAAAVVLHELRHKELHETKGDDYDHDAVTDDVETASASPWLDVFQANTYATFAAELFFGDTGAYVAAGADDGDRAARQGAIDNTRGQLLVKGDNELLAIIAEGDAEPDEASDWAFPGSQARAR
jgi:hypothetical protein